MPHYTSMQSHDDVRNVEPILRTLYDPPPRIDDVNQINATITAESAYVTHVTNGTLQTEDGSPHVLYYEVHHRIPTDGHRPKRGLTGLVLHGGPGAGCFPRHANFFSPELYEYVVLFDQRGCGRSTPLGDVSMNTLPLLVQDVERLRRHLLDVDGENRPWDSVLGGSWGCTLALAYAHSFPLYVRSMVLRGVCLFRSQEIHWLFGNPPPRDDSVVHTSNLRDLVSGGRSVSKKQSRPGATNTNAKVETASQLFSNAWKEFSKGVEVSTEQSTTPNNRDVLIQYYHRLLGSDPTIRARAAQSWFRWEMGIYSSVLPKQDHEITTNSETELLVWDPATKTWHYEDARVGTIHSVTSIDYDSIDVVQKKSVDDVAVQSLRRYSSPSPEQPVELENTRLSEASVLEPLPIEDLSKTAEPGSTNNKDLSSQEKSKKKANGTKIEKQSFDPTKFIPAHAMLTCFYATNIDYVTHPYRSFLALSLLMTSQIPPSSTGKTVMQCTTSTAEQSYQLPPCIAIQGGLDPICPPDTAIDLHNAWTELELRIALNSGHSMYDPVIAGEIVKALDRFGQALLRKNE